MPNSNEHTIHTPMSAFCFLLLLFGEQDPYTKTLNPIQLSLLLMFSFFPFFFQFVFNVFFFVCVITNN